MTTAEAVIATRKLKIKISTQRMEAVPEIKSCESAKRLTLVSKADLSYYVNDKNSSVGGSTKRAAAWTLDGPREKRQKMDRSAAKQCSALVKDLIKHKVGWIFSKPVDPVALNIPDYFTIISNPMDLGTIKSKLEKGLYHCTEEVASDVRLTFSNAMRYNPPSNDVHVMARSLNDYFETRWKTLEAKWNHLRSKFGSGQTKELSDAGQNCPKTPPLYATALPKKLKPSEKKVVKLAKSLESSVQAAVGENFYKGTGKHTAGSVNGDQLSIPAVSKCGACGSSTCQCSFASGITRTSSDTSTERSAGGCHHAYSNSSSKLDCQSKSMSTAQMDKSDPDSDGAISALDDGNTCPSSPHRSPTTDATSREGWMPSLDSRLSPAKALRAAMLKQRFADTILKAQHKTLLDNGDKVDPIKMQQEREKLERRQRQEKERIEAQLRAAEAASRRREEIELKKRREKEREAARSAIEKMGRTVEIEDNKEILKELDMLCGCSLSNKYIFGSALRRLGLFMKDDIGDWNEDEDILPAADSEEGEILG